MSDTHFLSMLRIIHIPHIMSVKIESGQQRKFNLASACIRGDNNFSECDVTKAALQVISD